MTPRSDQSTKAIGANPRTTATAARTRFDAIGDLMWTAPSRVPCDKSQRDVPRSLRASDRDGHAVPDTLRLALRVRSGPSEA